MLLRARSSLGPVQGPPSWQVTARRPVNARNGGAEALRTALRKTDPPRNGRLGFAFRALAWQATVQAPGTCKTRAVWWRITTIATRVHGLPIGGWPRRARRSRA